MTRPADWSIWIPHRFNLPLLVGQGRRSFDGARHTPSTVSNYLKKNERQ